MDNFLEKISQYDFMVNLLPGFIIYYYLRLAGYELYLDDVWEKLFFCYIAGAFIGRMGSLFVEPICKKMGIVKFAAYGKFLEASQKNEKINRLSEVNNLYRNFIATALVIGVLLLIQFVSLNQDIIRLCGYIVIFLIVLGILLYSYHKQTEYVRKNVEDTVGKIDNET